MRLFTITFLLCPIIAIANPTSDVFKYECEQVNAMNFGFSCNGVESRHLKLNFVKNDMNKVEKKKFDYEVSKFILRYINLGGTYIDITSKHWPKNSQRSCQATKKRTNYICYDCKWVEDADGFKTCKEPVY